MFRSKEQRTKIEDLSPNSNELFELSEERMMIGIFGGSGVINCPPVTVTQASCTNDGTCPGDIDTYDD